MVYSIISTIAIIALIIALMYKRTTGQENERQQINELNVQISEKQNQLKKILTQQIYILKMFYIFQK